MAERSTNNGGINAGGRCLLLISGQRFLVTVLASGDDWIKVTFPAADFPIEGMYVSLEFHDDEGFTLFESEVLESPRAPGEGLTLRLPERAQRNSHRTAWRVPADFRASVKGHVHPRVHDVPVLDVSAGGLQVSSDMDLAMGENVDVTFKLPGLGEHKVLGAVAHVVRTENDPKAPIRAGIRFINPELETSEAIKHYIRGRVAQLGPGGLGPRRRLADRPA